MPTTLPDASTLRALLAHAVPILLLAGALAAGRATVAAETAWARARRVAAGAWLAASLALLVAAATLGGWATAHAAVLVLVTFVGWVLTRYASTYLAGEPEQPRFVRWLLATLAGASLVVATGNFGVLVAAWLGASLSLQNLLTCYRDRPAALLAAHKKFLVSRTADLCLGAAAALLAWRFGTLELAAMLEAVGAGAAPGAAGRAAVVLVAVATLLKSAQLPFHGWLMQVMEAPTPVSALLHAGVVNLGGFVLIRLHPLVAAVPAAQTVLVVAGSLTAALAALVASTRISIKVALAWSTCAQMGFMVLQCGLGLVEMAWLHLIAHSLYKANAFLGAGTAVHHAVVAALAGRAGPARVGARAGAFLASLAMVWLVSRGCGVSLATQPAVVAMAFVVALALVPLLAADAGRAGWPRRLAAALAVAAAWFGLHHGLQLWLGEAPATAATGWLAAWTAACFALAFVVQSWCAARPEAAAVQRLHAWFFGGLFLDEWFTRLTLRVWPNPDPARHPAVTALTPADPCR